MSDHLCLNTPNYLDDWSIMLQSGILASTHNVMITDIVIRALFEWHDLHVFYDVVEVSGPYSVLSVRRRKSDDEFTEYKRLILERLTISMCSYLKKLFLIEGDVKRSRWRDAVYI